MSDLTGSPPRISVITIVKNGERYLAAALRSILAQTLPPYEIIVVVGESTDGSAAVARSFPEVRCITVYPIGIAPARNVGLAAARGDFIAFLDYDDRWAPTKLARQTEIMLAQPALLYTTTQVQLVYEKGTSQPREMEPAATGMRDGLVPSSLLARREAFAAIGGFDPAYTIGCDIDWFVRARDHQLPTAVIPEILVYKRLHETNISRNYLVNRQDMFRIAKASIARQKRAPHAPNPPHH